MDPDNLAALAATWLALAQRMSSEVGQGTLREATTRSSHGHVVIYAIGTRAVLVLIGDEGLDIGRLHRESQATLDTIQGLLSGSPPRLKFSAPLRGRQRQSLTYGDTPCLSLPSRAFAWRFSASQTSLLIH